MTRRREIERHLRSLDEIGTIMRSMKNLSVMEIHKIGRFLISQQRIVDSIERAAADFLRFHPMVNETADAALRVYVLIGSERGFCGAFNDTLVEATAKRLAADHVSEPILITVGLKLASALEDDGRVVARLGGPSVVDEVPAVLTHLVETINVLQAERGPLALDVVHHRGGNKGSIEVTAALPPFRGIASQPLANPPLLNITPDRFFYELVDHYLLAALYLIFYGSLAAEHQDRVQHLDAATRRLDEQAAELSLRRNALRQEEITEEIELIVLSTEALG